MKYYIKAIVLYFLIVFSIYAIWKLDGGFVNVAYFILYFFTTLLVILIFYNNDDESTKPYKNTPVIIKWVIDAFWIAFVIAFAYIAEYYFATVFLVYMIMAYEKK